MSDPFAGCDPDAIRYDVHWRPVLETPRTALLDRMAARLDGLPGPPGRSGGATRAPVILDVGTGTGALLLSAARRWPTARLVGLDPSAGMLSVARRRAELAGLREDRDRLRWLAAPAESIPLDDGSVDAAISAFVLQLVGDRAAVLSELRRVLRPGALLDFVTWLESDEPFPPDDEFDEAVIDLAIEEPEAEPEEREDDFASPLAAVRELEAAGFASARAEEATLHHAWSRDGYLRFKEEYDEQHLFGTLDRAARDALVARVGQRWAGLPDDAFVFRHPVVFGLAVRP